MSELDFKTDQQAIARLETEFPGWMIYRDGKGVRLYSCFARRHSDGRQVEGKHWTDLRDSIIGEYWRSAK